MVMFLLIRLIRFSLRYDGASPVYIASQEGHAEAIHLLLKAGADKDKSRNDGAIPLFVVC